MEEFINLSSTYYKEANIVIIVFARNKRKSFESWVRKSKGKTDHDASFMLLGSKYDLETEVQKMKL